MTNVDDRMERVERCTRLWLNTRCWLFGPDGKPVKSERLNPWAREILGHVVEDDEALEYRVEHKPVFRRTRG